MRLLLLLLAIMLAGCSDSGSDAPADDEAKMSVDDEPGNEEVPVVRAPSDEPSSVECVLVANGVQQAGLNLHTGTNEAECTLTVPTLNAADPLPFTYFDVVTNWAGQPTMGDVTVHVEMANAFASSAISTTDSGASGLTSMASGELADPLDGTVTVTVEYTWSGLANDFQATTTVTLYEAAPN